MCYTDFGDDLGIELVRQCWQKIADDGMLWSLSRGYGISRGWFDECCMHNHILWAVPAAIYGQDIKTFCQEGGFVDKIIIAAQTK